MENQRTASLKQRIAAAEIAARESASSFGAVLAPDPDSALLEEKILGELVRLGFKPPKTFSVSGQAADRFRDISEQTGANAAEQFRAGAQQADEAKAYLDACAQERFFPELPKNRRADLCQGLFAAQTENEDELSALNPQALALAAGAETASLRGPFQSNGSVYLIADPSRDEFLRDSMVPAFQRAAGQTGSAFLGRPWTPEELARAFTLLHENSHSITDEACKAAGVAYSNRDARALSASLSQAAGPGHAAALAGYFSNPKNSAIYEEMAADCFAALALAKISGAPADELCAAIRAFRRQNGQISEEPAEAQAGPAADALRKAALSSSNDDHGTALALDLLEANLGSAAAQDPALWRSAAENAAALACGAQAAALAQAQNKEPGPALLGALREAEPLLARSLAKRRSASIADSAALPPSAPQP